MLSSMKSTIFFCVASTSALRRNSDCIDGQLAIKCLLALEDAVERRGEPEKNDPEDPKWLDDKESDDEDELEDDEDEPEIVVKGPKTKRAKKDTCPYCL